MSGPAPYIYLILSWLFFGLIHSVLATDLFKHRAKRVMQEYYRYYRLLYSLLATACLLQVVYYHLACPYFLLWQPPLMQIILSEILIFAGLVIMVICARKYFMDLSGINAMLGRTKQYPLQITGMNAYVRHPLYSGTLLLVWALFFRYPYLNNLLSCVCMTVYTYVGMYFEEKKLVEVYGDEYKVYQKRISELIPWTNKLNGRG